MFYNGYVIPLFDYCCTVWGETANKNIEKLFKLQKRAARYIMGARFDFPSKSLFKELGWLTIYNRIKYHKGVLMFKCVNDMAPSYLCEMFTSTSESIAYSLRSTASNGLFVPRPNTNFMKSTFQYSGTVLWNNIPATVKSVNNIEMFKKKYFDYLISQQDCEF